MDRGACLGKVPGLPRLRTTAEVKIRLRTMGREAYGDRYIFLVSSSGGGYSRHHAQASLDRGFDIVGDRGRALAWASGSPERRRGSVAECGQHRGAYSRANTCRAPDSLDIQDHRARITATSRGAIVGFDQSGANREEHATWRPISGPSVALSC